MGHQVRLHEDRMREPGPSDEEERQYEVLNLENVHKIRKRPGAPKWTVRLSTTLRDYLQQREKAGQYGLVNAIFLCLRCR